MPKRIGYLVTTADFSDDDCPYCDEPVAVFATKQLAEGFILSQKSEHLFDYYEIVDIKVEGF